MKKGGQDGIIIIFVIQHQLEYVFILPLKYKTLWACEVRQSKKRQVIVTIALLSLSRPWESNDESRCQCLAPAMNHPLVLSLFCVGCCNESCLLGGQVSALFLQQLLSRFMVQVANVFIREWGFSFCESRDNSILIHVSLTGYGVPPLECNSWKLISGKSSRLLGSDIVLSCKVKSIFIPISQITCGVPTYECNSWK